MSETHTTLNPTYMQCYYPAYCSHYDMLKKDMKVVMFLCSVAISYSTERLWGDRKCSFTTPSSLDFREVSTFVNTLSSGHTYVCTTTTTICRLQMRQPYTLPAFKIWSHLLEHT